LGGIWHGVLSGRRVLVLAEVAMGRWRSSLLGRSPGPWDLGIVRGFHLVRRSCCVGEMARGRMWRRRRGEDLGGRCSRGGRLGCRQCSAL
jgi:hypothetical protein